jgi:hypothetical protein
LNNFIVRYSVFYFNILLQLHVSNAFVTLHFFLGSMFLIHKEQHSMDEYYNILTRFMNHDYTQK